MLASPYLSYTWFPLMGPEGAGPEILGSAFISSHLILKEATEGPQLSTWPQGSTPVQNVIKYLEDRENSGQDLRHSSPQATFPTTLPTPPKRRSRWPSAEMPFLTFLLIIKSLLKASFVTSEVQFAETAALASFTTML